MPAGFYINMVLRTINVTLLMSDGGGAFLFENGGRNHA